MDVPSRVHAKVYSMIGGCISVIRYLLWTFPRSAILTVLAEKRHFQEHICIVPSRNTWSLPGILGLFQEYLVPSRKTWSLPGILGLFQEYLVSSRNYWFLPGILGLFQELLVSSRNTCSLPGILGFFQEYVGP